jgi:hypothetical protein
VEEGDLAADKSTAVALGGWIVFEHECGQSMRPPRVLDWEAVEYALDGVRQRKGEDPRVLAWEREHEAKAWAHMAKPLVVTPLCAECGTSSVRVELVAPGQRPAEWEQWPSTLKNSIVRQCESSPPSGAQLGPRSRTRGEGCEVQHEYRHDHCRGTASNHARQDACRKSGRRDHPYARLDRPVPRSLQLRPSRLRRPG